jgi:ubiquinone/menaquinone biosynthesis C-methylase UbiE
LERLGYRYVNVDLTLGAGRGAVGGDAHGLPFSSDTFDIVISSDSLEHFTQPIVALSGVRRVLRPNGFVIIWVPFMHPFHGNDYYRWGCDTSSGRVSSNSYRWKRLCGCSVWSPRPSWSS